MDKLKLVTYCGLYCGLCTAHNRIPRQAKALRETMVKGGYEYWAPEAMPGFTGFWKFLSDLCDPEKICPGCRQGGGPPFCGIRKCAQKRNVDTCPLCDEFPCHRIDEIARGYITLIPDGKRLKEKDIDDWIKEQEERTRTGFAYADIRCQPYSIPEE